eukprot:5865659-Ditylum_brightwellii.AAC.1
MTEGRTVEEFLGIQVDPTNDGEFKLNQTVGLQDCNPAMAPTSSPVPLGPDPQGKGPQYEHLW